MHEVACSEVAIVHAPEPNMASPHDPSTLSGSKQELAASPARIISNIESKQGGRKSGHYDLAPMDQASNGDEGGGTVRSCTYE